MTATPLLRGQDFRALYLAAAVSQFGSQVSVVALPLLAVTALGAGPGEVGLLSALGTLVVLLVGLPVGTWVDRTRRRRLMIAADLVRAVVLGSVPVAWWAGALTMPQLYLVAVAVGAGGLLFDVAAQSLLPHLVGRDRLPEANSALVATAAAMDVSGRSLAGVLAQLTGASLAILLDAATYLWSAWLLRTLRDPETGPPAAPAPGPPAGPAPGPPAGPAPGPPSVPETVPPSVPETVSPGPVTGPGGRGKGRRGTGRSREPADRLGPQIAEGIRFVLGDRVLLAIAVQGAMVNLAFPLCSVLLPVLLVGQLGHPAWVYGAFLATGGLGTLAGSALAHRIGRRLGTGRATWLAGVVTAPAALFLPLMSHGPLLWLAAAAWLVLTFRTGVNNVLLVSFRQRITPDPMLGRMNATMRLILTGAVGAGALLAGLLGEAAGVRAAIGAGAVIMALSWLPIYLSPLRRAA
ncbi:MFS transporter [Sphaerisporangium sp. TRM90804]|uniref:MFS transporter n=1 Tax=Sphaerisporangium sp. TRM90804 TaxID=3031113 RepID=UPI002446F1A2|nr:MFS transporter [Sphaerisporangium sp. TRM90804]MDH2425001.1 MFS transporter [Sphaerisporangium sp. TRM90804]